MGREKRQGWGRGSGEEGRRAGQEQERGQGAHTRPRLVVWSGKSLCLALKPADIGVAPTGVSVGGDGLAGQGGATSPTSCPAHGSGCSEPQSSPTRTSGSCRPTQAPRLHGPESCLTPGSAQSPVSPPGRPRAHQVQGEGLRQTRCLCLLGCLCELGRAACISRPVVLVLDLCLVCAWSDGILGRIGI